MASNPKDTVTLETMPEQHRESHRAARNWGKYPLNGSVRLDMPRSTAEWMIENDRDAYDHIVEVKSEEIAIPVTPRADLTPVAYLKALKAIDQGVQRKFQPHHVRRLIPALVRAGLVEPLDVEAGCPVFRTKAGNKIIGLDEPPSPAFTTRKFVVELTITEEIEGEAKRALDGALDGGFLQDAIENAALDGVVIVRDTVGRYA